MQIPKFMSSDVVIMDSGREKMDVASVTENKNIIMIEHPFSNVWLLHMGNHTLLQYIVL